LSRRWLTDADNAGDHTLEALGALGVQIGIRIGIRIGVKGRA
jgi:hypothetical protein